METRVLPQSKWEDATDGTVSEDSHKNSKIANSTRGAPAHNTAPPEPADSAKPRVWIKTAILCSTLNPPGCLAAGPKRKTFGSFRQTDKGRNEKSWFCRSRGHGGGGDGKGRWLGSCVGAGFTSLNTGWDEASVPQQTRECGHCSLGLSQCNISDNQAESTDYIFKFNHFSHVWTNGYYFCSDAGSGFVHCIWFPSLSGSRSKIPRVCRTAGPAAVCFVWKYHLGKRIRSLPTVTRSTSSPNFAILPGRGFAMTHLSKMFWHVFIWKIWTRSQRLTVPWYSAFWWYKYLRAVGTCKALFTLICS